MVEVLPLLFLCVCQSRKGRPMVCTASIGLARPGRGPEHSVTDSLSLFTFERPFLLPELGTH